MKCLVTGGAGFIGSHLTELLVGRGEQVRVLDDLSTGHLQNLDSVLGKIEFIRGSVADETAIVRAVAGVEVVFHLAAKVSVPESFEKPDEYEKVNVHGTAQLLDAARKAGVRRVVFSSSCAVYGDTTDLPIKETAPPKPLSPYAANKLAAEELGLKVAADGLAFTALRYFNVFGPRQDPRSPYSGVISLLADRARSGQPFTVHGDGGQSRDFIAVADVAEANVRAATRPGAASGVANICTGRRLSLNELIATIERISGRPIDRRAGAPRPGDIRASLGCPDVAQRELGFVAAVGLEAGLQDYWRSLTTEKEGGR